jgi:hypothetical protein
VSWSWLQSASGLNASGNNATATFTTANLSSSSKLIAWAAVIENNATPVITGISDGLGNNFTQVASVTNPSVTGFPTWVAVASVWVLDTPAGDAGTKPTISAATTGSVNTSLVVEEVSGLLAGTSCLDGTAGTLTGNLGGAGSTTSPTYSSSVANEYLASFIVDYFGGSNNPTWTKPSGTTLDTASINSNNSGQETLIAYSNSAGGSESSIWSVNSSDNYSAILVAFKLAGAGGTSGPALQQRQLPNFPVIIPVSSGWRGAGHSR